MDEILSKLYDNLSYSDLYSGSIFSFFILTIIVGFILIYTIVMRNAVSIRKDFQNQRCNPKVMPFVGLINPPTDGTSWLEYTKQNFDYCLQTNLEQTSGQALLPLSYMTSVLTDIYSDVNEGVNDTRNVISNVRTNMTKISEDVYDRILSTTIPLQQFIINTKSTIAKMQGVLVTSLYTSLTSVYILKSLMGAIEQMIVKILVSLVIIIFGLWLFPFTWVAAGTMTAIFASIAIPLAAIMIFMKDTLHIEGGKIPKLRCFSSSTQIKLENGLYKQISNINIGDKISNSGTVTAKFCLTAKDLDMYNIDDICVSGCHKILYKNNYINVSDHPNSTIIDYSEEFVWCLNTTEKIIKIDDYYFSDWDELYEKDIQTKILLSIGKQKLSEIHEFLDGGFSENTIIEMKESNKLIKDIKIGDILKDGIIVYGIVEIDVKNLFELYQYSYTDQNNIKQTFIGGPNLSAKYIDIQMLQTNTLKYVNYPNKLFNLLTNTGSFYVSNIEFLDYNSLIDSL